MENSPKSIINRSKSILILLPTRPYFDQVAAGLSLYLALKGNKDVVISSPSEMTVEFNKLVGVDRVTQDLGNKNLVIEFSDYPADNIEKVNWDIEEKEAKIFKLSVIPKKGQKPPERKNIDFSYSGVSADTVLMIGGANESHFPAVSNQDLAGANLVHIGTRDVSFSSDKDYISFSRPAASVSEIVYDLIKESGLEIDADIATNLLAGIEDASNRFSDSSVSAETFAAVSALMKSGGKRLSEESRQQKDYPPGAIPGQHAQSNSRADEKSEKDETSQKQPQREEADNRDETPKEWLEPKIYKGTSTN